MTADGDMPALGACLSRYWEMKKVMAGPPAASAPHEGKKEDAVMGVEAAGRQDGEGDSAAAPAIATTDDAPTPAFLSCEPAHVRQLMKALRPHALGMSLAGAGGGGFLVCVLRDPLLPPEGKDASSSRASSPGGQNNAVDIGVLQGLVAHCVPGACAFRVAVDEEGLAVRVDVCQEG